MAAGERRISGPMFKRTVIFIFMSETLTYMKLGALF